MKKSIATGGLIIAMALGLAGCGRETAAVPTATQEAAAPTVTVAAVDTPTVEASSDNWQTVTSAEGRFSAEMPGEPQVDQSNMTTSQGEVTLHSWVVSKNGPEYTLMYVDYPEDAAEMDPMTLLRGAINGVAKDNNVISDEETTMAGKPAIAAEVEDPDGNHIRLRVIMSGNRMYQLLVVTSQQGKDIYAPDAQRFFDSFELTE